MTNEESRRARQKALRYPLPWRIWAYGIWITNELPEPQGLILSLSIVFGTIALIAGVIMIAPWLLGGGLSWLFWLLLGMLLAPLLLPLWRGLRSLAREIYRVEQYYRRYDDASE